MAMNMGQARGYGAAPKLNTAKKMRKMATKKCNPGFIMNNGKCIAQTDANKKRNAAEAKHGTTVDKANQRFYK